MQRPKAILILTNPARPWLLSTPVGALHPSLGPVLPQWSEPATLTKPLLVYSLMPQGWELHGLSGIRDQAFCPENPWEGLAQISIEAGRPFRKEAYSEELTREKNM